MAKRSIRIGVNKRSLESVLNPNKGKCKRHGVVNCTNLACQPRERKKK